MPITDIDETIPFADFKNDGGVTTGDTFNIWRKKTNGIINAIDSLSISNVGPTQLSAGAPTWDVLGNLATSLSSSGLRGSFTSGPITAASVNTGALGSITTGNVATNTLNAANNVTSKTLTLAGGTGLLTTNGAILANSLAIGSSNRQFTVNSSGAIAGTSLNVGSGTITTTGNIIAAAPTQESHLATKAYVDSNRVNFVPPGAIMAFAMNSAPTGWLAANGSSISTGGANANLFAAIGYTYGGSGGSFNLPDLRGYFVRGAGINSDGTGSGVFGGKQADELKSHTHTYTFKSTTGGDSSGGDPNSISNTSVNTGATGGIETRPKNIAMLYCIKI